MGLEVVYYQNIKQITPPDDVDGDNVWDWCSETGAFRYFTLEGFEDRLDGIPVGWMIGDRAGSFEAGPYSSYTEWRDLLSHIALGVDSEEVRRNPESWSGQPFFELIYFAYNDGCIGPKTSAKLATDFEQNRSCFADHSKTDCCDIDKYDGLAKAFRTAADTGCIMFD